VTTRATKAIEGLVSSARALGCDVRLDAQSAALPQRILDATLDPDLGEIFESHDGIRISGEIFALFVYGTSGPETLEWSTRGLRSMQEELAYPLERLVSFAQVGYQASYLCCVPDLASGDDRQPVLYVDVNEAPWAVPVASTVARVFELLTKYLDLRARGFERTFPREVPELVREDARLVELARKGAFDRWLADQSARKWLEAVVA
jgi:hypothetical protein